MPAPLRLLIVMPSWVGDCVMATPTLRVIRSTHRGAFIGTLLKPGIDQLLGGLDVFDEVHVERQSGLMETKAAAQKVRPRRYDTVLLLRNSFSSALMARMAGIPRRIGYSRDARGMLLTDSITPPRRADGDYDIVPAVDYYWNLAHRFLFAPRPNSDPIASVPPQSPASEAPDFAARAVPPGVERLPPGLFMELATTPSDEANASGVLERAGIAPSDRFVVFNPGANKDWKRWPADRFAELASIVHHRGLRVLLSGAPAEASLIDSIAAAARCPTAALPRLGLTIGGLKALIRRAALLVTNDTGPRHIAAAVGTPLVTLFGPTDHRWAPVPTRPASPEIKVLADPSLPETESANDHRDRCSMLRITIERVATAIDDALRTPSTPGR